MKKFKLFIISTFLLIFVLMVGVIITVHAEQTNNTNAEEEKLYEFVDNFYATIFDSQGRIVSSTNPNNTVDSIYSFTDTTTPSRYVSINDNLFLHLEAKHFKKQDDKFNIQEEKYYYLDLPTYIVPNNESVLPTLEEEKELLSMGAAKAYGGIYEEGSTGYRFKVRFKNIKNAIELNLSYQLSFKLSNTIYNQTGDLKTINVEDVGGLNFYVQSPILDPEPSNYSIVQSLSNINYTSSDIYDLKTTLTDIRENVSERKTKGSININLGNSFGFNSVSSNNPEDAYLCAITVKVNGTALNCTSDSETKATYTNDSVKIVGTAEDYEFFTTPDHSILVRKIKFNISSLDTETPAEGIETVEISLKEKLTTTQSTTYSNSAAYEDYLNDSEAIDTNIITSKAARAPSVTSTVSKTDYTDGNTPTKLNQSITIAANESNYETVILSFDSFSSYEMYAKYVFNSSCLDEANAYCTGVEGPQFYIDDEKIEFDDNAYNINTSFINGDINPSDPQLLSQIKRILGSKINNYPSDNKKNYIKVSSSLNSDGERYIVIFSVDTINTASLNREIGHSEYATFNKTSNNNYYMNTIPSITMYILNVSNHKVDVKIDYDLGEIFRGPGNDNGYYYYFTTKVENNTSTSYRYNYLWDNVNSFMVTKGTHLNGGIVKWDTIINTTEMKKFKDNTAKIEIYSNSNSSDTITSGYYDINNKIINNNSSGVDGTDYIAIRNNYLYSGTYDSVNNKCAGPYTLVGQFGSTGYDQQYVSFNNQNNIKYSLIATDNILNSDMVCLTTFTQESNNNDASIEFELNQLSEGIYRFGNPYPALRYISEGKVDTPNNGVKTNNDIYIDETDMSIINEWSYNESLYKPDAEHYTYYNSDNRLPYLNTDNYVYYNGAYQFYDKMNGTFDDQTTLDYLEVNLITLSAEKNIVFNRNQLNSLENKQCDSTNGNTCATIIYPQTACAYTTDTEALETCLKSNYGNDYMNTLSKMKNGFSVIVTGIDEGTSIQFDYRTKTSTESSSSIDYLDFTLQNSIYQNAWSKTNQYNYGISEIGLPTLEVTVNKRFAAGIYVEKSAKDAEDKVYLSKDSAYHEVTVENGFSSTEYIEINDMLFNGADKNNTEEYNKEETHLLDLNKSLLVTGLTIKSTSHDGTETTIYESGEFKDGWENSTILFDKTTKNIYTLRLVKTTGTIEHNDKFTIGYNLVIDMDNAEATINPTYRESDYYEGGNVIIPSMVEAIRPIDTQGLDPDNIESENESNYVDFNTNTIHCFTNGSVSAKYLTDDEYEKLGGYTTTSDGAQYSYTINYKKGSAGKTPIFNVYDKLFYQAANTNYMTSTAKEKAKALNRLLLDYTKISSISIRNIDTGITILDEINLGYTTNPISITDGNSSINMNYVLDEDNSQLALSLSGPVDKFDTTYMIDYTVKSDLEAFAAKALEEELITSNLNVANSSYAYSVSQINNVLASENAEDPSASYTSGYISLNASKPRITKSISYPNDCTDRFTINTSTGKTPNTITIVDQMTPYGYTDITDALSIKNITIKKDNNVIYENETAITGYENNINISIDGLKMTFTFKNTNDVLLVGDDKNLEIVYDVVFDPEIQYEKYKELTNYWRINNTVKISNTLFENSSTINSAYRYVYNRMTNSKRYLGNGDKNSKSRFEISTQAPNTQHRENIVLTDTVTLSSDFGDYLSLTDMIIKLIDGNNETIIYDYKNRINLLNENMTLTDTEGEELEFEKNGEYQFKFNAKRLEKGQKIVIEYELSVDEEKYSQSDLPLDTILNIYNNLKYTAAGNESYSYNSTGNITIPSRLGKKYNIISTTNDNAVIKWTITTNLDVDCEEELTENDVVTITDELFSGLTYIDDSINVYTRKFNGTSYVVDHYLVKDTDYKLTYENNVIEVQILNPTVDKNLVIEFRTNAKSTEGLKNYVTLSVNSKNTYAKSDDVPMIFLRYLGGTIVSRNMVYYTFTGNKYLDGNLSSTKFKFNLVEVDEQGNAIPNGLELISENNTEGKFDFDPIKFESEGTHYYKITEINEQGKFEYDTISYILKVTVVEKNNDYVIDTIKEINDHDEIKFTNKSIQDPEEPPVQPPVPQNVDPNLPDVNPNTDDNLKISIAIFAIIVLSLISYIFVFKRRKTIKL